MTLASNMICSRTKSPEVEPRDIAVGNGIVEKCFHIKVVKTGVIFNPHDLILRLKLREREWSTRALAPVMLLIHLKRIFQRR